MALESEQKLKLSNQDILFWDTVNWSQALHFWNTQLPDDLSGFKVLELGAMNGGLSAWLASKGASVICSDITPLSNEVKEFHKRLNLQHHISYEEIDATEIPHDCDLDLIIFKSILGGIGRHGQDDLQLKVFQEIHRSLKTHGQVFFAENLSGSPMHQWARSRFVNWGKSWNYIELKNLPTLLNDFKNFELHQTGFLGAFGLSEKQRQLLGTIDTYLLQHFIPKNWNYISYGYATK